MNVVVHCVLILVRDGSGGFNSCNYIVVNPVMVVHKILFSCSVA